MYPPPTPFEFCVPFLTDNGENVQIFTILLDLNSVTYDLLPVMYFFLLNIRNTQII